MFLIGKKAGFHMYVFSKYSSSARHDSRMWGFVSRPGKMSAIMRPELRREVLIANI